MRPGFLWARWMGAILCCAAAAGPAAGADRDGNFAVDGVGILTCRQFVEERAKASDVYARLLGWLEGYITAANRFEAQTFDLTPWQSTGVLAVIIDNHCRKSGDERFSQVVQRLLLSLQRDRLAARSPMVTATVGDQTVGLYADVLRKAQAELKRQGQYGGAPDGQFGPMTQQAFAGFQQRESLAVTGLPDQATLWKLIEP